MASLGRRPGAAPLTSADIPDNSITAAKIVADTIAAGDIADDAVGTAELANDVAISTTGAITTTGAFTSIGIDDNADALAITIDSSENVGIGGTPAKKLDIHDTKANVPTFRLTATDTADGNDSGDVYGAIEFASLDASNPGQAYIKATHLRSGTGHDASDMGLAFGISGPLSATSPQSGTIYETPYDAMVIDNSGNVGIGTDSPDTATGFDSPCFEVAGTDPSIVLSKTGADSIAIINHSSALKFINDTDDRAFFQIHQDAPANSFVMNSSGNVNIPAGVSSGSGATLLGSNVTLFTMASRGTYIVSIWLGASGTTYWSAYATIIWDGAYSKIVSSTNGTYVSISISGATVRASTAASAYTESWTYLHIPG